MGVKFFINKRNFERTHPRPSFKDRFFLFARKRRFCHTRAGGYPDSGAPKLNTAGVYPRAGGGGYDTADDAQIFKKTILERGLGVGKYLFSTALIFLFSLLLFSTQTLAQNRPTPSTGTGPFYPVNADQPMDNDLTAIGGKRGDLKGKIMYMEGVVSGQDGKPIPNAEMMIWQTDSRGKYDHPDDPRVVEREKPLKLDPNFQYAGKTRTDENGRYRFKTIVPGHYKVNGIVRPNHVHYMIRHPEFRSLASEMNFVGDPNFERDFVTSGFSKEQLAMLQVELNPAPTDGAYEKGAKLAIYNIVLRKK